MPVPSGKTLFPISVNHQTPRSYEHTIDTAAIADIAFLCRRNGCKTGPFQDRAYQAVPQKVGSVPPLRTKKRRALDQLGTDYPAKGRRPFRRLAHRSYGDRSREQVTGSHALSINLLIITSKKNLMTPNKNKTPSNEPITLVSLLKALGQEPISTNGDEFWYASVFGKRTDNKIVLTVNNRLNTWFDSSFGLLGKGGNLMDFARTYWADLSTDEIGERLQEILNKELRVANRKDRPRRKRKATKIPHYEIDNTGPLGYNREITDFLMESGLWELADLNIQEVYYYVIDQKGNRKDFCAAGWPTENGGWEVRAQNYTGCIGPKGMTSISVSENVLAIFPDYVDYLKRRHDKYLHYASVLILNHPDFLSASVKRARHFERVLFYVDDTRIGYQSARDVFNDKLPDTEVIPL